MEKEKYTAYVDKINEYLRRNSKRELTDVEEDIILEHLVRVAENYNSVKEICTLSRLLCVEAARKVSEIHPDMEAPKEVTVKLAKTSISKEVYDLLENINERGH